MMVMERRRPGPPAKHQERDAAIVAAVLGGASIIGTARIYQVSESRVRFIVNRELTRRAAAEEREQQESLAGRCCAEAEAAVWRALADTAKHRRRDCGCAVCAKYRSAVGL